MNALWRGLALGLILALSGIVFSTPAQQVPQPSTTQAKIQPKLEPIAETKLIMEGLAHANYRGLERLLQQKPADDETWKFARGQALLLAETANLLMLRPPRNEGQPYWFQYATDFRTQSTNLAQLLGQKDFDRAKAAFVQLANTCNRCHQTFRTPVEISPFADPPAPKAKVSN